ncbi:MAG: general stress protein [Nostochopsis sp.]
MVVGIHRRAVGVFSHRRDAEAGLHELRDAGFPMDTVSVVAREADRKDQIAGAEITENIGNKADEGAATGAVSGGVLGGLTGLLVGLGTLAIPGIGPIMLAGAAATTLATTIAGAGIGAVAGGLLGALIGLGIPEERARVYNERVDRGHYLVIIDGIDEEIARAEAILRRRGIEEFEIYDIPVSTENHTVTPARNAVNTPVSGYGITPLHRNRRAIGAFSHHRDAEAALMELRNSGFPMNQISLIAKDSGDRLPGVNTGVNHNNVAAQTKTEEGAKAGAATGGVLGGLGGLLVGLGALAIPGVGPVIAGGAVATALATTVAGGAIGAAAGGLTGGLIGLGIPENRARLYSDRFNRGDYLVMVDGTDEQIHHAEAILKRRGITDFDIFDATDRNRKHHTASVTDTSQTSYSPELGVEEPKVIIVDRREI